MSKKLWFYLGFFVLLLGVFYLVLFWGTDLWRKKLPTLNDVKEFEFVNQDGDTITNQNVAGKVHVVEFFFTTCKGICPRMNTNLAAIAEEFSNDDDFMILSHTVDPDKDTVGRMKYYADSLKINSKHWLLLTGTKEKLYEAARKSYLLDDQNNETAAIAEQFIHTQLFALVDKSGKVRGIYDGLNKKEIEKLRNDIQLLLKERYSGPRFVNGVFQNNPS
ncbi:MAG: SCO family protein [Chitinophagaceae bacterium]|nr:SCO family protein [Chitinophagaceae bacterium]